MVLIIWILNALEWLKRIFYTLFQKNPVLQNDLVWMLERTFSEWNMTNICKFNSEDIIVCQLSFIHTFFLQPSF